MRSLILAALLLSHAVLHAQMPKLIPTDFQPIAIHQVDDTVHVFCNGNDIDYDGKYEPENGEKPASWLKYHATTSELLSKKTIEHTYFSIPFRPAFWDGKCYNPNGNAIEVYDLTTQALIDSSIIELPNPQSTITAVYVQEMKSSGGETMHVLACSHKTSFTQNGIFSLFGLNDAQLLGELEIGINPQKIRSFTNLLGVHEFAVLCEGTFGGKNSALYRLLPTLSSGLPFKSEKYDLGDTGNFFVIQDQLALTVMNGSHEIIPINLATNTVLPGFPIGTTGYDGPREVILDTIANRVYVSTYASDIRIGSLLNGDVLGSLDPNGKPEGMGMIHGSLWACNAYKKGDYAPDSTIAIFALGTSSIRNESESTHEITLKDGICTIVFNDPDFAGDIQVIDAGGKVLISESFHGSMKQVSLKGFPQGLYGLYIRSGSSYMNALVLHRN